INGFYRPPCLCVLSGHSETLIRTALRSGGHSGTSIAVRDLCVRSRSCDH
ncbi:unnamed protein product, partial [Staurois parvus]